MLRCTVAGLIPLMISKKYSAFSEKFYHARKTEFDEIMKTKSYFLLRELPTGIAAEIIQPELSEIILLQKRDGLWSGKNSTKITYDVLSALSCIGILNTLLKEDQLKYPTEKIKKQYDYYSLLIKKLFLQLNECELDAEYKLLNEIKEAQNENGSWGNTVIATVYHMEKLLNLGANKNDSAIQKGIDFLMTRFNDEWKAQKTNGETYGLLGGSVFSTGWDLEFEAAKNYRPEWLPRQTCFHHLGIMQNAFCLKLLLDLGLEEDELVKSALDGVFALFKSYHGLCYFEIQKKRKAMRC